MDVRTISPDRLLMTRWRTSTTGGLPGGPERSLSLVGDERLLVRDDRDPVCDQRRRRLDDVKPLAVGETSFDFPAVST